MPKSFSEKPIQLLDALDTLIAEMQSAPRRSKAACAPNGLLAERFHAQMRLTFASLSTHSTRLRDDVTIAETALKTMTKALQDAETVLEALEKPGPAGTSAAAREKVKKAAQGVRKSMRKSKTLITKTPTKKISSATGWHMAWKIKIV